MKMNPFPKYLNQSAERGFTAVELMVSAGLLAITVLMIFSSFQISMKGQMKSKNELEEAIDTLSGENLVFVDLKNIDPSFNLLRQEDDRNQNFFDFIPDVPERLIGGTLDRVVTLSPRGKAVMYFLETHRLGGPMFLYDPVLAYNVGDAPADMNTPATLTFVSLNQNDLLSVQRPNLWAEGRYILMDTPAKIRRPVNGMVDLNVPPRSPAFVGRVEAQSLVPSVVLNPLINRIHPLTGVEVGSADQFLRTLPTVGGGSPHVRLRPVRILRYSFEEISQAQGFGLFRSVLEGDEYKARVLVADQLEYAKFTRRSVTEKLIEFVIKKKAKGS